jgi:Protein kinase domain
VWYHPLIPARIGTEFAGYRIEALLGRGGSSTVYRAEAPRLGVRVALKILNAHAAQDESFRERFVRESTLAAAINHPNVITIYDAGAWGEDLFIALRYVAGGDLNVPLKEGPLELNRALAILAQIGSGLDAAHSRGLIHRDVKPANVMLDSGPGEGAPEIAYVTDFGLIKHVQSSGRATPTDDLLGTIDYVAPEQIEGRAVDGKADVYSLGCVAFECLTGRVPFARENDAAVLWAHMKDEPPPASDLRPELPGSADDCLARALAKEPEKRFDSCLEFVDALRHVVDPQSHGKATVALPRVGRSLVRSVRWPLAAAGGAACLALGVLVALAVPRIGGDESSRDGDAAAVVETRTVVSTVVEREPPALVRNIPAAIESRCTRAAVPTPDFAASMLCRPGGPVELVRYSDAVSNPYMGTYLRRKLAYVGLPVPGPNERVGAFGSCEQGVLPAVEEWVEAGRGGHDAVGHTQFSDSDGLVLCYLDAKGAHIEWSTANLSIYAHAYGPNYNKLLNWWKSQAGPVS